jgi:hypothetical protein
MTTYSDTCTGLPTEDFPMCPLCGDAEEIDLGHIQECHRLTNNMDKANNRDKRPNQSRFYWTARKKTRDNPPSGVGLKNVHKPEIIHTLRTIFFKTFALV